MFTGLVIEMGHVASFLRKGNGARLSLRAENTVQGAGIGDSISVNGTCLTVVEKNGKIMAFDLSDETLDSTNLGELKTGEKVNLEPSLRMDSRLGGHFVTGHIDSVGKIRKKTLTGDVYRFVFDAGHEVAGLLVEKGSVAVDGISLTVVDVYQDGFSVVVIPHTASMTTLGFKGPGDRVNIEADILGKYVAKFLNKGRDSGFMQKLREEGYA